ncbi:MAG: ribosome silencing factor [Bacilli bacterium]|nr:ribosome silencing factor [Bacilli bacterium]HKM11316.1 ribosome silencing factor [Bacilli bacterium]
MNKKIKTIITALEDKKGDNVLVYDVKNRTPLADYYVIVTAKNPRLLNALADQIDEVCAVNKFPIHHIEGKGKSEEWILIDAYDVIVHIFSEQARHSYQLEDLLQESKILYQTPTPEDDLN